MKRGDCWLLQRGIGRIDVRIILVQGKALLRSSKWERRSECASIKFCRLPKLKIGL
jgi:hypothetical protein